MSLIIQISIYIIISKISSISYPNLNPTLDPRNSENSKSSKKKNFNFNWVWEYRPHNHRLLFALFCFVFFFLFCFFFSPSPVSSHLNGGEKHRSVHSKRRRFILKLCRFQICEAVSFKVWSWWDPMARARSSASRWRYCNPSYYLKRPKRLALLFIAFVCVSFLVWDRQTLVREHEVNRFFFLFFFFFFLSKFYGLFGWRGNGLIFLIDYGITNRMVYLFIYFFGWD